MTTYAQPLMDVNVDWCRRFTCENVMRVLRSNKDSVMAMLEAFVHDPLINWRLLNTTTDTAVDSSTPTNESGTLT